MRNILLIAACVGIAGGVALAGDGVTGSGRIRSEKRSVPAFTAVGVSGAYEVDITIAPGATPLVEITGDDNVLPLVRTRVKHGSLEIDSKEAFSTAKPLKVRIVNPQVSAFAASGANAGTLRGIRGDKFAIDLSGTAKFEIAGATRALAIRCSGGASLLARGTPADAVAVDASGGGTIEVTAAKNLAVSLSGSVTVDYWGRPRVAQSTSGSASVRARR